jgi:hypothetical protein
MCLPRATSVSRQCAPTINECHSQKSVFFIHSGFEAFARSISCAIFCSAAATASAPDGFGSETAAVSKDSEESDEESADSEDESDESLDDDEEDEDDDDEDDEDDTDVSEAAAAPSGCSVLALLVAPNTTTGPSISDPPSASLLSSPATARASGGGISEE